MKKKYLMVLLSGMVCLSSFTGCGKEEKKESSTDNVTKEVTEEPTEEATEEPTEEPTEEAEKTVSMPDLEASGLVEGNTYTNSELGFSYSIPDTWIMNNVDQTYEFMASTSGMEKEAYRTTINQTGVYFISSGMNSEDNGAGGKDNYLVQAFDNKSLGFMDMNSIIDALIGSTKQQFTAQGATCKSSDPEKTTIGSQDVYSVEVEISHPQQEIIQQYHFFMNSDVTVCCLLTTTEKENLAIGDDILSSMKFD